jgi:hypothetical protein
MFVCVPSKRIIIAAARRRPVAGRDIVYAKAKNRKMDKRASGGAIVIISSRKGNIVFPNAPYLLEKRMSRFNNVA